MALGQAGQGIGRRAGTAVPPHAGKPGQGEGLIGTIFRGAQNKLTDPAKLKRVVSLIDAETWIGIGVDVNGAIYEGLLERNAAEVKT